MTGVEDCRLDRITLASLTTAWTKCTDRDALEQWLQVDTLSQEVVGDA